MRRVDLSLNYIFFNKKKTKYNKDTLNNSVRCLRYTFVAFKDFKV